MTRAFVAIGSNIAPAENVMAAVRGLAQQTHLTGVSMVYLSEALGRPEQPHYYNCVAEIETDAAPVEVKHGLRAIEDKLGRRRGADKYAPRTIDLDLIAYGEIEMDTEEMRLPDPQILERPFLATPLRELAPDLVLPGFGVSMADIAARLPQGDMTPLVEYAALLRAELRRNVLIVRLPDSGKRDT